MKCRTSNSPARMELSGIPFRVHGMVSFYWIVNRIMIDAKKPTNVFKLIDILILGIFDNDFNRISWTHCVTIPAHIASGMIDDILFIMLIYCLERALFLAFPAGNAFFCDVNTSEWDEFTAKGKASTQ